MRYALVALSVASAIACAASDAQRSAAPPSSPPASETVAVAPASASASASAELPPPPPTAPDVASAAPPPSDPPKGAPDGDEGGGGRGEGIGLGNFGGISGVHTPPMSGPNGPKMREGAVAVNGRLPPEIIQRIVRQQFGRLRLCYTSALKTHPKLAGRVAVKFVINEKGDVTMTKDGGSDLPDTATVTCIVRAFGNLSFPQPESGIVTVVYPIMFSPS